MLKYLLAAFLWSNSPEVPSPVNKSHANSDSCAVSGMITMPDKTPARAVQVRLRPQNFLLDQNSPVSASVCQDALTDSFGRFTLTGISPGAYTIEVMQGDSLGWMHRVELSSENTTTLNGNLAITGKFRGFIALPDSAPNFFVQIYGLARRISILPSGSFSLALAPGEYAFRVISESSRYRPRIISHINMISDRVTMVEEINSRELLIKPPDLEFPATSFPKP